jgi:hypothetical protein
VKLPLALAELGLMDGMGSWCSPGWRATGLTLFAGLSKRIDLMLVSAGVQFGSGGDAVCLITGPVVESTTHVVGHLLQEIESALREHSKRFEELLEEHLARVGRRAMGRQH